tara:strand:+ start:147 stop:347 length:201 start_codon:yes stop_codon:yes gene_type:complete
LIKENIGLIFVFIGIIGFLISFIKLRKIKNSSEEKLSLTNVAIYLVILNICLLISVFSFYFHLKSN